MKKIKSALTSVLIIVIATLSLTACGEVTYTAESGFYYSSDKGHSYGDGAKEYAVGETVYPCVSE